MEIKANDHGFRGVFLDPYVEGIDRIITESTMIGDYEDSMSRPGSSFLWVGADHHLNREQVKELVGYMQHWLDHGGLPMPEERKKKQ